MKTKTLLKGAVVAIVLFVGVTLLALSPGISCEGRVSDQYGSPIEDVYVRSTVNPELWNQTDANGHYFLSGLAPESTVEVVVPAGFSASGSTVSQPLTGQSNVVDFTLHDDSY